MTERQKLEANIAAAKQALAHAERALEVHTSLAENNVYQSLDDANGYIYEELRNKAEYDCEGAHNCGNATYTQLCMVEGVVYLATMDVEYNRHDKTYYFVDGTDFKIEVA